jgi:hypothetical protein
MTMRIHLKVALALLPALYWNCVMATTTTTTQRTKSLRGKPVVHTRTVYHHHEDKRSDTETPENLVDTNHPHGTIRMRGTSRNGVSREFEIDVNTIGTIALEQYEHHHSSDKHHLGMRVDSHVRSAAHEQRMRSQHFDDHEQVEHDHISHEYYPAPAQPDKPHQQQDVDDLISDEVQQPRKRPTIQQSLPTGLEEHYNHTLYEELHNAPFVIYERVFGNPVEGRNSFPVFIVPEWRNTTGVFSGFSRTATPLVFENMQFLLSWEDIVGASSGAHDDLVQFMEQNNFHATLIIGKAMGETSHTAFLGLMVSYFQSTQKNILVPFATLDNFFHDTSEQHLLSEDTKHLEFEALHEMLDEERINNSTNPFYHPSMEISHDRKQQLEYLEAAHFRRLFQLLIRRSFLFSFGYADCLKTEPHALRDCLDDTFSIVVKMETTVRGALDEELLEELAGISKQLHSKVSEACVSVSGVGGTIYGAGSCDAVMGGDLGAFVVHPGSFFR